MRFHVRLTGYIAIGAMILSLIIASCGGDTEPYNECPAGSMLANPTDSITGTPKVTWEFTNMLLPGAPLGAPPVGSISFTVKDNAGQPRNGICMILQTDGFWWNNDYTRQIVGKGPANRIAVKTDENGTILLFWTTEPLPASNAATAAGTAGTDQTGLSQIYAASGAISGSFDVEWTVKGCAGSTFGPPATCP